MNSEHFDTDIDKRSHARGVFSAHMIVCTARATPSNEGQLAVKSTTETTTTKPNGFSMKALVWAASLGIVAGGSWQSAEACGGTFCDNVTGMAVDQTGENILFAINENRIDAHIQIQYDPMSGAESFAWVVPVSSIPDFSVGSDQLFSNLLNGSVPFYGTRQVFECVDDAAANSGGDGDDGGGDGDGDGDGGDDDPKVVKEVSVGAFEIKVLSGGTVDSVMQWLDANGFAQDESARPILAAYLSEGFLFVAMKLSNQAGVDELQPIVLSYEHQEPCVPLRLTKIAAAEDMHVRTFFYSEERIIPENYRHVEVNPLKINWLQNGENYPEVVAMAVDAEHAQGNAFVTEFAGPSNQISTNGLFHAGWDPDALLALQDQPTGLVEQLERQGLMTCYNRHNLDGSPAECVYQHPLIAPILRRYLPVPEGLEESEFYSCLSCFVDQIDLDLWSADGFTHDFKERIYDPGLAARDLVESRRYLTRMYTRISPSEMNVDPMFVQSTGLPDVANRRVATRRWRCGGDSIVELPDGRSVNIPAGGEWPDFSNEMPWEERVAAADDRGGLDELASHSLRIDDMLAQWNATHPPTGDIDDSSDPTNEGGSEGEEADKTNTDAVLDVGTGCACRSSGDLQGAPANLVWASLLALTGPWRRPARSKR